MESNDLWTYLSSPKSSSTINDGDSEKIIIEGRTEALVEKEKNLQNQLDERRKHEEILWKYKSRVK